MPTFTHDNNVIAVIAEETEIESDSLCQCQPAHCSGENIQQPTASATAKESLSESGSKCNNSTQTRQRVSTSKHTCNTLLHVHVSRQASSGASSNMESSEPLLLDTSDSSYSNGRIESSALIANSDHAVLDDFDRPIDSCSEADSEKSGATESTANNNIKSTIPPTVITPPPTTANCERKSPKILVRANTVCLPTSPLALSSSNSLNTPGALPDAVRNRQRFATRSVSTDNPLVKKDKAVAPAKPSTLSRLGSTSGPLLRANSFEKSTQTTTARGSRANALNHLEAEHKSNSRHESNSLSNLGVECMKATGALAVPFKQLQRPTPPRIEIVSDSSKTLNYETSCTKADAKKKTSVTGGEVCTIVHMSGKVTSNNRSSHVIVDSVPTEEPPAEPEHHHIGYRLGRRKVLAERRRKIADLCCLFALLGLALMITEEECRIANVYAKVSA